MWTWRRSEAASGRAGSRRCVTCVPKELGPLQDQGKRLRAGLTLAARRPLAFDCSSDDVRGLERESVLAIFCPALRHQFRSAGLIWLAR